MAIIYTYPRLSGQPEGSDLVLITDVSDDNKSKNTTIQSIIDQSPQGTVTDVILTMPDGFNVTPDRAGGVITLAVTGFPSDLPADDPDNSVQFNLNGTQTGIPEFIFFVSANNRNTLNLGRQISPGDFGVGGHINLFDRGRLSLWAAQGGGSNQAVSLTGPRTIATSNPGSYTISLPAEDPSLNDFPIPPGGPTLYEEPRIWVINGDDVAFREYDSQFMRPQDINGAFGNEFQLQFRKPDGPVIDPASNTKKDNSGIFDATEQLRVIPLSGDSGFPSITTGLSLSIGSMSRTASVTPQRGAVRVGSGPINQDQPNDYGGTLLLEYVYPGIGPVTAGLPGQTAAAYAHVGFRAPKYDNNIEIDGDGRNLSIQYQDYDLILPQLNPEYSTNNQPYEDASSNNISQILVVNPVDVSNNSQRFYETKFVSVDNLGIGAAGQNGNIQFNNGGDLAGDSAFIVIPNNNSSGVPAEAPKAHELVLGAGGGGLPGMLTIFGDNDDIRDGGTAGILRFMAPTGQDFATITGPDNQTEITATTKGSGYVANTAAIPTTYNGNGSGLQVYIEVVNEQVDAVSLAAQGSGYSDGDVLTIVGGDNNATITVVNARAGADEKQMYDIKLPKYAPGDDKIWFGKGTGKNTELTTDDYFKIKLVDFDPGEGHHPGGRLQLEIGSPNLSVQEPWGSILLNGGNNTNESGVLRLASVYNNRVGVMGPQAVNPSSIPEGESYNYDFMLPALPPRVAQREFINGVDTASINFAGTNLGNGNFPLISTTLVDAQGNPIPNAGQDCMVGITIANGILTSVNIVDAGDGYAVGNILRIDSSDNPIEARATITVDTVLGNEGKVLVVNKSASNTEAFPYETRWIDFPDGGSDLAIEEEGTSITTTASTINFTGGGIFAAVDPNDANKVNVDVLPRLNHGFSPFPIYQGDNAIEVTEGDCLTIACNTICDIAAGQLTKAKIFGTFPEDCVINVAVYSGELGDAANTQLIAYGNETVASAITTKIFTIDLDDMKNYAVWSPAAGTPIVVVIEIDNVNASNPARVLGSISTQGASQFGPTLSFSISSQTSAFDANNIAAGDPIVDLEGYSDRLVSQDRISHHFDPF
jgi:hypothetical protein